MHLHERHKETPTAFTPVTPIMAPQKRFTPRPQKQTAVICDGQAFVHKRTFLHVTN
jgi:hypothetical protein